MSRRRPARAGRRQIEDVGATRWAERAASELRASGETARRRDVSTATQLTRQEPQVAALIRQGVVQSGHRPRSCSSVHAPSISTCGTATRSPASPHAPSSPSSRSTCGRRVRLGRDRHGTSRRTVSRRARPSRAAGHRADRSGGRGDVPGWAREGDGAGAAGRGGGARPTRQEEHQHQGSVAHVRASPVLSSGLVGASAVGGRAVTHLRSPVRARRSTRRLRTRHTTTATITMARTTKAASRPKAFSTCAYEAPAA